MKKRLATLIFCFLAIPLIADTHIRVEPAAPREGDEIEILVGGNWGGALSGPSNPVLRLNGSTIAIDLTGPPSGPISVDAVWAERVHVGRLQAGTYNVIVRINGDEETTRHTFTVEEQPFSVVPAFGSENTQVLIEDAALLCTTENCLSVKFGAQPATDVAFTPDGDIIATAPAGTGTVDVTVTAGTSTLVLNDGFRYGTGFEDDYERVLFPVTLAGRGNHGSEWHSEIIVRNDGPVFADTVPVFWQDPDVVVIPIPMAIPPGERGGFPERETDGGAFLNVPRGLEKWLSYSSHAVDLSRGDVDLGTEIPVVHAEDTSHTIRIVNVPVDSRYRATLRIYDFDLQNGRQVDVQAVRQNGSTVSLGSATLNGVPVCPAAPCIADRPAFAIMSLSGIAALQNAQRVDLILRSSREARIWAFVSVTNNDTQHVTVYTPQHDTP